MQRRHDLVRSLDGVHLECAWHHATHDEYWSSRVYGLAPNGKNLIDVHLREGFETRSLPNLRDARYDTGDLCFSTRSWLDADPYEAFSVGVSRFGNSHVLALVHSYEHSRNSLVLYGLEQSPPPSEWSIDLPDDLWPGQSYLQKIAPCGEIVYVEVQPGVVEAIDIQTGHVRAQARVGVRVQFLRPLKTPAGKTILFVACLPSGCKILDDELNPCEDWSHVEEAVRELCLIEAVADDMSSVVGRLGAYRLVHIRIKNRLWTDLWNPNESKYPNPNLIFGHPDPEHVVMSPCGKAVAYILWNHLLILDVPSQRIVLCWQRRWDPSIALSFDGSGRWLVFAHADNQFEVFQLIWNAGDAPWSGGAAGIDVEQAIKQEGRRVQRDRNREGE